VASVTRRDIMGLVLEAGTIIAGKFRIERILGQGGMGIVAAATHLALDQQIALKVVHARLADQASVIERFLREARAAARLHSEHVCRVFDVGQLEGGAPYIVMELLDGQDLARVIAQNPLAPASAVDHVLQACVAIAEAHALGIVHRDLKPANLFLTRRLDGSPLVKVLDFGIAKSPIGLEVAMTQSETVMGSPGYMSPEQLRSARDVDARTDIWALGTILYQAVSGRLPFPAESITELAVKIAVDPPEPLDVEPAFRDVVFRCLEKDPARRHRDIAALARALVPFGGPNAAAHAALAAKLLAPSIALDATLASGGEPVLASAPTAETGVAHTTTLEGAAGEPVAPGRRGRRAALVIGAALAVGGLGVATWTTQRRADPAAPAAALAPVADAPPPVAATAPSGRATGPATPEAAAIAPAPARTGHATRAAAKPGAVAQVAPRAAIAPAAPPGAVADRTGVDQGIAIPATADVAKQTAQFDAAIAKHRCSDAGRLAPGLRAVSPRFDNAVHECLDQRTSILRNPAAPAAEPWALAAIDELDKAGDADDARTLRDSLYQAKTLDACGRRDTAHATEYAAKISSHELGDLARRYCRSQQIELD
jgi:serine/threonine-protein kinase